MSIFWAFTAVCHSSSERKACTRSILVGMSNVKTLGCVGDAEAKRRCNILSSNINQVSAGQVELSGGTGLLRILSI